MKRTDVFLMSLLLILLSACGTPAPAYKDAAFSAVILSDLHFTADAAVVSSVVPAMPYAVSFTRALIREVIDRKPDVLIITGDNTNSGAESDMHALAEVLKPVKEAGITIVMTTGNHDFSRSDPKTYEAVYGPLFSWDECDKDSLSCRVDIGGVRLLAMDDNAVDNGATGTFSAATLNWLKQQLKDARRNGLRAVFLSHHNVLAGKDDERSFTYRITNENLVPLLKQYGVRLCLTGHLHSRMILEDGGLYEIISAVPLSGAHDIGFLTIQGSDAEYHNEPADLERYGQEGLAENIRRTDEQAGERFAEVFESILEGQNITGAEKEGILNLSLQFMRSFENGTLRMNAERIRKDPYYERMLDALWNHNYGPWIKSSVENPPADASSLRFRLNSI